MPHSEMSNIDKFRLHRSGQKPPSRSKLGGIESPRISNISLTLFHTSAMATVVNPALIQRAPLDFTNLYPRTKWKFRPQPYEIA